MPLYNMLASSVAGALMFSTGALGRSILAPTPPGPVPPSSANCTVIAIGYSEAKNQELLLSAGVHFSR
jgi:hypothetical protein